MSALRIGMLRDRVRLETMQRTDTNGGGGDITWSSLGELYARVDAVTGRELEEADARIARATHRITIRYRADLAPAMRFVWGSRIFRVLGVAPRGSLRRWLECTCEEETA